MKDATLSLWVSCFLFDYLLLVARILLMVSDACDIEVLMSLNSGISSLSFSTVAKAYFNKMAASDGVVLPC